MVDRESTPIPPPFPENELTIRDDLEPQVCRHCSEPSGNGEAVAEQDDTVWHLECLPSFRVPITRCHFSVRVLPRNSIRVENWVQKYNDAFRTMGVCQPRIPTVRQRALLEAFKFCSAWECIHVLPRVCAQWRSQSSDAELWAMLLQRTFGVETAGDPREEFAARCCLTCYGCLARVAPGVLVAVKHPLTRQPLCSTCFSQAAYRQMLLQTYCELLAVSAQYVWHSGVTVYHYNFKSYVLPCEARERVCAFRQERRDAVVAAVSDAYLQALDILATYERRQVQEAIVNAPSDQVRRYVRYVFCEYDTDLSCLMIVAPNRRSRRRMCVCPAQLSEELLQSVENAP